MKHAGLAVVALLAAGTGLRPGAARAQAYTWTTLDFPGTDLDYARGINAKGQVVGSGEASGTSTITGWLYSPAGGFQAVPTPTPTTFSLARAINGAGLIAGSYIDPKSHQSGYLSSGTHTTSRRLTIAGATQFIPVALNKIGQAVGSYTLKDGFAHAFLSTGGTAISLDPPGAVQSFATAINDSGVVVGHYDGGAGHVHGFIYSAGTFTQVDVPGGTDTLLKFIGANGAVAGGYYDTLSVYHGFTRVGTKYSTYDFGNGLFTEVLAILPHGQVIGQWRDVAGVLHGFNFLGGIYFGLDFPGADATILGVTQTGSIVGAYTDSAGHGHGFLATCPADQKPCRQ